MKKIVIIIGTRPEAIKLIPVYFALEKTNAFEVVIVSTGQHHEMLNQIFSFFEIKPRLDLGLMIPNQSLAQITSLLFKELDHAIEELQPDCVVVQGDTTSAMVGSMVGFYKNIRVAHVEAGLRSFEKYAPFPEEINRRIVSQVADLHFAPTLSSKKNLDKELVLNVYITGNTVVDSLLLARQKVFNNLEQYKKKHALLLGSGKLILITAHRRESFGDGLKNMCAAVKKLAELYPALTFIYPVHLNPNIQQPVRDLLGDITNVKLIPPLQYDDMVFVMSQSHIILTDSGGVQEEAPALNIPVIVLREITERPEGIEAGCSLLAGTSTERIIDTFNLVYCQHDVYSKMSSAPNPFGDGSASLQIAQILQDKI